MIRRLVLVAATAAAMFAAAPAVQAAPAVSSGTTAASSGTVAPMAWQHSGFYSSKKNCDTVLAATRAVGIATAPNRGPCYYSQQHGFFYYYWG